MSFLLGHASSKPYMSSCLEHTIRIRDKCWSSRCGFHPQNYISVFWSLWGTILNVMGCASIKIMCKSLKGKFRTTWNFLPCHYTSYVHTVYRHLVTHNKNSCIWHFHWFTILHLCPWLFLDKEILNTPFLLYLISNYQIQIQYMYVMYK